MRIRNIISAIAVLFYSISSNAAESVRITDMPIKNTDAYYEGVAKVVEAAAKINHLSSQKYKNPEELVIFLAGNSLQPIASILSLPNDDENINFYKEVAIQAAQLHAVGRDKICLPVSDNLNREDIKKAINLKFEGPFERNNIGVLVVGAMDALSEIYPCK